MSWLRRFPHISWIWISGTKKNPKRFMWFDESTDRIEMWERREVMKTEERECGWIKAEIGENIK